MTTRCFHPPGKIRTSPLERLTRRILAGEGSKWGASQPEPEEAAASMGGASSNVLMEKLSVFTSTARITCQCVLKGTTEV